MERTGQHRVYTEDNTVADYKGRVVMSGWKDPVQHHFYKECTHETIFCFTNTLLSDRTNLRYRLAKLRSCLKGLKILLPREAKDHNGNREVLGF